MKSQKSIEKLLSNEIKCIFYQTNSQGIIKVFINPKITNSTILSGSFNPLHEDHIKLMEEATKISERPNKVFELSISNCDKGSLNEEVIKQRIDQFYRQNLNLLITNRSQFFQKVQLTSQCSFVLGYDTFTRLIDLNYYDNDIKKFKQGLQKLKELDIQVIIGGRINPKNNLYESFKDEDLRLIEEEMEYKNIFKPLHNFRIDISSTQIREQMK